ncbi:hypothetical protein Acr_20g0010320 [Actinidia rufa]|uniref:Uncharacterized protein n=1 Tax=Actinidia rufa TaxID=165716 RepID=A0A7J0GEK0_9ERIC|nr:hypothetical protein Acr_20g0010320 [Actinidia rufa]
MVDWLLRKEDSQDITIKCLQTQLAKMAQIFVDNRLMKPIQVAKGGPSEDMSKRSNLSPRRGHSQAELILVWIFRETLNAKRNQEGDLRAKLNNRIAAASDKVITVELVARTTRPEPREPIPRYQTPFSRDIEGMDSPKNLRRRGSHCTIGSQTNDGPLESLGRTNVSSVPIELTGSQVEIVQLAPRGINWELSPARRGICSSEELAVASYKLGLTLRERLWEDLTLSPPADLRDLMSRVEMFAQLEDDVRQAERTTGTTPLGEGQFKRRKAGSVDYENRAKQGINVVFKEPIYKFLARIRDKPYFKKPDPWEGTPKGVINGGSKVIKGERRNKVQKLVEPQARVFQSREGAQNQELPSSELFLDQLVWDGHLKEFVDQEKTKAKEAKAKPNPSEAHASNNTGAEEDPSVQPWGEPRSMRRDQRGCQALLGTPASPPRRYQAKLRLVAYRNCLQFSRSPDCTLAQGPSRRQPSPAPLMPCLTTPRQQSLHPKLR